MKRTFVLDACALIALLAGEPGAEKIRDIVQEAIDGIITLKMNQINLLEVYYCIINIYGQHEADKALEKIKEFPVEIIVGLADDVFKEAGRIKSKYKIPLGDSIAVAESSTGEATLVTSDYKDFQKIETFEKINVSWFR